MKPYIVIVDYNPDWPELFQSEMRRMNEALREISAQVEHVGSTSIPGLASKSTIDILVMLQASEDIPIAVKRLEQIGYCNDTEIEASTPSKRLLYQYVGETRTFQVHIIKGGDPLYDRYILFRDYLRSHAKERAEYERLKRNLARQFGDRVADYTSAKDMFILNVLELVRQSE